MENNTLQHHGILGQKWGVRRFQNKDGALTPAGKKRASENSIEKNKTLTTEQRIRKIAIGTATIAVASYVVHENRESIGKIMSNVKNIKLKDVNNVIKQKGKDAVELALNGAKEGIKEGLHDAPKKATKTVLTGAGLYAAKKILDSSIGKEQSAIIFQANDNKKIGKFWKTQPEDRDDDD